MSNFDHHNWRNKFLTETRKYEVEYWRYTHDGYDNNYVDVMASSEEEAIELAKKEVGLRLNKDFKVVG